MKRADEIAEELALAASDMMANHCEATEESMREALESWKRWKKVLTRKDGGDGIDGIDGGETLPRVELLELDAILEARIKKWAEQKDWPEEHRHGADPQWFTGFCEGQIRELRNVREMLYGIINRKDWSWAKSILKREQTKP